MHSFAGSIIVLHSLVLSLRLSDTQLICEHVVKNLDINASRSDCMCLNQTFFCSNLLKKPNLQIVMLKERSSTALRMAPDIVYAGDGSTGLNVTVSN